MVKSDADDQLLLSIPLTTMCKIRSIKVSAPAGKSHAQGYDFAILSQAYKRFPVAGELTPTRLRVFTNRPEMGFDDVEDFPATQEWELTPEMLTEDAEPLQVGVILCTFIWLIPRFNKPYCCRQNTSSSRR